jgi:hypothetical protein
MVPPSQSSGTGSRQHSIPYIWPYSGVPLNFPPIGVEKDPSHANKFTSKALNIASLIRGVAWAIEAVVNNFASNISSQQLN